MKQQALHALTLILVPLFYTFLDNLRVFLSKIATSALSCNESPGTHLALSFRVLRKRHR